MLDRQNIRNQIITLLTNSTDAGANVFDNRMLPMASGAAHPYIAVYVHSEELEPQGVHLPRYEATLKLATLVMVKNHKSPADEIDTISEQVRNAIMTNQTLLSQMDFGNIESHLTFEPGERGNSTEAGELTLWTFRYLVEYVLSATDPLETIEATVSFNDNASTAQQVQLLP
jgi:hypothetical protein